MTSAFASVTCQFCRLSKNNIILRKGVSTFADDYKSIYIPTTTFQKIALSVGASLVSLMNPTRGDMIAILGEASGERALQFMHSAMLNSEEGREILREAPRINSKTVDLNRLRSLPEGTVGRVYYNFLEKNKVTPDSRLPVQFVDDVQLAYTMQRYRETHDLNHAVLGMPTNMLGEVTVKWVEAFQTRLPMCIGGAIFGAMRLKPKQRQKYISTHLPWAIRTGMNSKPLLCVYFEKRWDQPLSDLHKELNIVPL
uniref:Ubiquinone biosynthesis protein COQ4 homolog, mitochondrial n=1 Tax=Graphocephala atropunctata TaxID=36148 RepID=A0A1B6LGW4_9HEMI